MPKALYEFLFVIVSFFKKWLNMRVQHALLVCTWFDIMSFLTCHALETRLRVRSVKLLVKRSFLQRENDTCWCQLEWSSQLATHQDYWSNNSLLVQILYTLSVPIVPFGNERCVDAQSARHSMLRSIIYERCINRRSRKAVDVNRMTKLKWSDRMRESRAMQQSWNANVYIHSMIKEIKKETYLLLEWTPLLRPMSRDDTFSGRQQLISQPVRTHVAKVIHQTTQLLKQQRQQQQTACSQNRYVDT